MKTIVIGGATGAVGLGIVQLYLEKGHRVIAIVRDAEKRLLLDTLLASKGTDARNLHILVNGYEDIVQLGNLNEKLEQMGTIDLVVASLGGWYHGPALYELPLSEWDIIVNNSLSSHFRFAKAILPVLTKQKQGTYILINGGASEYPVPHSGVISVMAAAQKMMAEVLHHEAAPHGVHVAGVAAFAVVRTHRTRHMSELWLGAEDLGEYILSLSNGSGRRPYWHRLQSPADLLV